MTGGRGAGPRRRPREYGAAVRLLSLGDLPPTSDATDYQAFRAALTLAGLADRLGYGREDLVKTLDALGLDRDVVLRGRAMRGPGPHWRRRGPAPDGERKASDAAR